MDAIQKGWFSEMGVMWPGQAMSLKVEEVLFQERSKYQDVQVLKTAEYGNVLVLDGVIQCTKRDEFSYQEMIVHLPVNSHPNPEKVLVIGGGDGGVARELSKHPAVKQVVMCEIDQMVIDISKKYLPYMSSGFDSPKLTLHVGDGFDFMKKHKGEFDVIITDSSDPVGPAESLFKKEYYQLMKTALKPGGIVCTQESHQYLGQYPPGQYPPGQYLPGPYPPYNTHRRTIPIRTIPILVQYPVGQNLGECLWLHLDLIKDMLEFSRDLYPVVDYGYTTIPTYPSGQIGFVLCSLNPDTNFRDPVRTLDDQQVKDMGLRYYNSDVHRAAFVLPQFAKEVLQK